MTVAIACTGLDHISRGFESFSSELFNTLRSDSNIHLLKASGLPDKNVHVLPTLKRTSNLYQVWPFSQLRDFYRYRYECLSFGYSLLPSLIQDKYDLIHFSDWILGDFLYEVRRKFNLTFKLLLSNGGPYQPNYCNRFDAIQQVALSHYQEGISAGIAPEKAFLVPYGFDGQRLIKSNDFEREKFRQRYRIPPQTFVVISLAALNSSHKRIDWLIKEFSCLNSESFYLVMAGQREGETPDLERLAKQALPKGNYQFLTLPYKEIPTLLWSSDLMVLCSLQEGFGRVLCEAMGASLPLLLHPHSTAKWLINCQDCFVDMTKPEKLHHTIQEIRDDKGRRFSIAQQNLQQFNEKFEWNVLRQSYLQMYEKIINYF
jgi:glycosyltransferase involved in cell wall biosynthesis